MFTRLAGRFLVAFATKLSNRSCRNVSTSESTQMSDHSNVRIARKPSDKMFIWETILGYIQAKNHSCAPFAARHFLTKTIWLSTQRYTLVTRTSAQHVGKFSDLLWNYVFMRKLTLYQLFKRKLKKRWRKKCAENTVPLSLLLFSYGNHVERNGVFSYTHRVAFCDISLFFNKHLDSRIW